tara:strand:+ start:1643 stop:1918 length:276 start_codon:yes stop_codon:yes gene_type:complete
MDTFSIRFNRFLYTNLIQKKKKPPVNNVRKHVIANKYGTLLISQYNTIIKDDIVTVNAMNANAATTPSVLHCFLFFTFRTTLLKLERHTEH